MSTMTEVFPCFFLSCKANSRVKPAKTGHGPYSSSFLCCSTCFCAVLCIVYFLSFSVLFVCICVLYYCHRVATQLQLNIYHIPTKMYGVTSHPQTNVITIQLGFTNPVAFNMHHRSYLESQTAHAHYFLPLVASTMFLRGACTHAPMCPLRIGNETTLATTSL
jgi:hypothetical protein